MNKNNPVNTQITAKTVRIVDNGGAQLGVFRITDALNMAREQELDLLQINGGEVPVCRICDAGKFLFDQKKNQRENAKRQRALQVEVKEIQLRPVTDSNDIFVKARKASDFLTEGDKVKITVRFKGRERTNKAQGRLVIDTFLSHLVEYKVDRPITDSGKDLSLVISSVKSKSEIIKDKRVYSE